MQRPEMYPLLREALAQADEAVQRWERAKTERDRAIEEFHAATVAAAVAKDRVIMLTRGLLGSSASPPAPS